MFTIRVGFPVAGPVVAFLPEVHKLGQAITNAPPEIRDFPEEQTRRAWSSGTTKEILANRRNAAADAARIIGPAAVLSDFSQLPIPRAEKLVAQANSAGRPPAILQLYRPASQPRRLFWSVTVPQEKTACGEATFPYARLPSITESGFWTMLEPLGESLIPAPLRAYLAGCRSTWPVRLTIVPTGLLGIPFDNLTVDTDLMSGDHRKLVECADVVLTGSLAMTDALSAKPTMQEANRWLKVYDHANLQHTHIESDAMEASHAPVEDVTGAHSVSMALGPEDHSYGVFALGVHGTGDPAGWGQTKIFPDGTRVTAAESLQWTAPRTAVLSSCHSSLETTDGTELSGFPAALLLRGATTVIGSLDRIDDASTAEIMAQFWRLVGMGNSPVHALAQAKRQWLAEQADRWGQPRLWAPLIAYGTD
ncbi:CHAT domain-containing protein [Arthrobacter sp. YAF34]|uniref:CHAT domain-containing protein n=1 Tax=Arthrobacter sp. YAF34 TaxID=3233083 RepID=UPI003F8E143D